MNDEAIAALVQALQAPEASLPDNQILARALMPGEGQAIAEVPPLMPELRGVRKLLNLHRGKDDTLDLQVRPTMSGGKPGFKYLGVTYRKILD